MGNVRRLRDASGNDLGGYRYTAFGQTFAADAQTPSAAIDQPLRWKGRWFEENIAGGVYEMRARWWSPQLGAFLSIDGYLHQDPNSTLWSWSNQNPMVWLDPDGHAGGLVALFGGFSGFSAGGSAAAGSTASGSAVAGGGLTLGEAFPPVLIATVSAVAIVAGERGIDTLFQNAQAGQQADFAADINAFNAALAAADLPYLQASSEQGQIKGWAQELGLSPQQVGNAIERIKASAGLKPNQNVDVEPNGDVTYEGEVIGNVFDEVQDCKKKR